MKIESAPIIPVHRSNPQDELDQKLKEVSKSYEKHFLREMVKAMRSSVPESSLIPKNMAERIYAEKMDEQYVETWGDGGGLGMAELIYQDVKAKILGTADQPQPLPKVIMPLPAKDDQPPILKMQEDGFELSLPASGEQSSVRAPMPGVVRAHYEDQGRQYIQLDHGPSMGISTLSFRGWSQPRTLGEQLSANQDLGRIVDGENVLQWKWRQGRA